MEMRAIATRHVAKEIKIIVKVSDINRDTLWYKTCTLFSESKGYYFMLLSALDSPCMN